MSKQIVLAIGDTHFEDKNYGRHKDYANDCLTMMDRIATTAEEYAESVGKFYRIVMLGDFADTRFTRLEFRVAVENFLERLNKIADRVYCLHGNHDSVSGSMCELDYYKLRGLICDHPEEETIGGKVVRYVDFVRDPEECAQAHEGEDVEVIFTHNALGSADNTLFDSVNVSKLDAPKLRVAVMGHIHAEMYFKAHNRHGQDVSILDGGAACVRSASRKDVESFNLLTFHFDGETGKIGSKKLPVKYPEDAFVKVEGEDAGKWSVEDANATQISFDIAGTGSMDIDDLAKRLNGVAAPEVISAVKMLFEKYGNVTMSDVNTVEAESDDSLLDDITNMFKSAPAETNPDTAKTELPEPEPSPSMSVGYQEEFEDALDMLDSISGDTDDDVETILSESDKEALRSGVIDKVRIDDDIAVVYRDGNFYFA